MRTTVILYLYGKLCLLGWAKAAACGSGELSLAEPAVVVGVCLVKYVPNDAKLLRRTSELTHD